ncbi:MAG: hypothetical protein ACHQ2Z_13195, partial [Elusimicrobiota bacterium]
AVETLAPEMHAAPAAPISFEVHTFPTVETHAPENVNVPPPAAEPAVESLDSALDKLIAQTLPTPATEPVPEAAVESVVPTQPIEAPTPERVASEALAIIAAPIEEAPAQETPVAAPASDAPAAEPVVDSVAPARPIEAPTPEHVAAETLATIDGPIEEIPKQDTTTTAPDASDKPAAGPADDSFESTLARFGAKFDWPTSAIPDAAPAAAPVPEAVVPAPAALEPVLTPLFAAEPAPQAIPAATPEAPPPQLPDAVVEPIVSAPAAPEAAAPERYDATLILPPAVEAVTVSEPIAAPIVPAAAVPPVAQPQSSVVVFKVPRALLLTGLPVVCLIGAFLVIARFQTPHRVMRPKAPEAAAEAAAPPAAVDPKAADALALVQHWRMAGDNRTLFERLGSVAQHPGGVPAWSVELTDEDSYLVMFREVSGTAYAFETNMKTKTVQPTPEAVERLTLIRVRDEASAKLNAR